MEDGPQPDVWSSYFYPRTEVLRNTLAIRDPDELAHVEYAYAGRARDAIANGDVPIEGDTAAQRLSSIHSTLFGEIYDWAGEYRVVNMTKGGHGFGDHNSMGMYMRQLDGQITRFDWESATFDDTVDKLADLHTDLNFAHPFREGNGRTSRLFMADLAAQHDVQLDFEAVDKPTWNEASAASFIDPAGLRLDYSQLRGIYHEISTPEVSAEQSTTAASAAGQVTAQLQREVDHIQDPFDTTDYSPASSTSYNYDDYSTGSQYDRDTDLDPEL